MHKITLSLIIAVLSSQVSWAQTFIKSDTKQKYVEGNSFFLFEEYRDALQYYNELIKEDPDNGNLNYRIGICYLNIPGEKEKAIAYLEKAKKYIDQRYNANSIRERGAPLDVYFYLGHAYRINNQLDKALEMYRYFKDHMDPKIYKEEVVNSQIEACLNAKKAIEHPIYLSSKNLGEPINSRYSDYDPIVSGDEKSFAFMRKLPFYDAVFFSQWKDGKWTPPINLTPDLGIDQDFYTSSFSYDGKVMYLYKNDQYDGNIYISRFIDGKWTRVIRLNDNINTKYWESHASVTKDGKLLYFTSNRKGGYGGLDIYRSALDSTGNWGPPENLGPVINTAYNEETPFITYDGTTLFFSSYGHKNMGGYDIFYSNLLPDGQWSEPVNMGYPVNTTDDDIFYQPIDEGFYAYYSRFDNNGEGEMDIFKLEIFSAEHPRKFSIKGFVAVNDVPVNLHEDIQVLLLNKNLRDTLKMINPDTSGNFHLESTSGEYTLAVTGEGFVPYHKTLVLTDSMDQEVIHVPPVTLTLSDLSAELEVQDTLIYSIAGDTVNIQLSTEKRSSLTTYLYQDSVLLDSKQFDVNENSMSLPILPPIGSSRIILALKDRFGNETQRSVRLEVSPSPVIIAAVETIQHKLPEPVMTPAQLNQIQDFLDILKHYATGSLYDVINNINPVTMNLKDQYTVISYLKSQAEENDYTPEDVDRLLIISATRKMGEVDEVYQTLIEKSSGDLKQLLSSLDLKKENINTTERLFSYLEEAADSGRIDTMEIKDMVIEMATEEDPNLPKIYKHLSEFSEGKIRTALENIASEQKEIYSAWELSNYLLDKADVLGYEPKDLIYLFAQIATNGDPSLDHFLEKLKEKASEPLLSILNDIDTRAEDIRTIKDLMDHLLKAVYDNKIDNHEILKTLMRVIVSSDINDEQVQKLITKEKVITRTGAKAVYWIIPVILAGLVVGFILLRRKKKKEEEE